jgi:hypothetical protein
MIGSIPNDVTENKDLRITKIFIRSLNYYIFSGSIIAESIFKDRYRH